MVINPLTPKKKTVFTEEKIFEIMGYFKQSYEYVVNQPPSFFFQAMNEINRSKTEKILLAQLPMTCYLESFGHQDKKVRDEVYKEIFK